MQFNTRITISLVLAVSITIVLGNVFGSFSPIFNEDDMSFQTKECLWNIWYLLRGTVITQIVIEFLLNHLLAPPSAFTLKRDFD